MAPAQDAGPKPRGLPYVLFDNIEIGPKDLVVEDFLGVGEVSCWYGEPGAAKSVLIEDLGLHVAAARAWHNRAVAQGAVLYIALERAHVVKRRAAAFKIKHDAHGLPFAVLNEDAGFPRRKDRGHRAGGRTRDVERRRRAQGWSRSLSNTISRALCGGDENSPKDIGSRWSTPLGRILEGARGAHVCARLHP